MKVGRDRRGGRVHRTIEHAAYVRRSFEDVSEIISRHGALVMRSATDAAGARTATLLADAHPAGGFDPNEPLTVVIGKVGADRPNHLRLECSWTANREKRLLANVSAGLDFAPVAETGRRRTTEIRLRADYDPAPGWRHSPESILFGRRVVRAALLRFLEETVRFLEEHEETLELRIDAAARDRAID